MSSTVIDRARPAGHRAPHRGSGFTGTLGLLRLYLRRDRVSLPLWVLLLSVPLATVYIASVETVYPDRSARAAAAAAIMASPAQRALYGPVYNDSLGAVGIWKAGMFHTLIAVAVILTVIRHTRADEESGRAELIDSTVVGRYANLTGALLLSFGASIATGAIGALGLLATDVAPAGSVAFGVALAASGMVFTAVAAVAAQLSPSARFTRAVAFAVLGTAFALRAIGDAGSGTLSWCSPLGWSLQVRPYAGERWWVLLLSLATAAVLTVLAYRLRAGRDVGAGLIAERPGAGTAGPMLSEPFGLAWQPVGDIVPRRRTVTTGGWRTLVVPPQPAHRPIPGRLPTPAAWSCHAALGPTLRRAPADTGGPWVARVAERWLTARVTRAASVTSPSKTPHAVTSPR